MKNNLKSRLTRSHNVKDISYSDANVITAGDLHSDDIINEIIKDGLAIDREIMLEVIKQFNLKVAEKVLSGYSVNTGLASMNPEIKGLIYNGKWNPAINRVGISFKPGEYLLHEINETKVEIMENEMRNNEITDMHQAAQNINNAPVNNPSVQVKDRYLHIDNDVPACGVAFRRWLCKA